MKYTTGETTQLMSGANIAPLVGIFMALAIVFLIGAVPAATTRFETDLGRICGVCFAGKCDPVGELRVAVTGGGLIDVNGQSAGIADLRSIVVFDPKAAGASRFNVFVQVEPEAEYGDVLLALSQLRQRGFDENQIRVYDPRTY